jgi:hypothetical protein
VAASALTCVWAAQALLEHARKLHAQPLPQPSNKLGLPLPGNQALLEPNAQFAADPGPDIPAGSCGPPGCPAPATVAAPEGAALVASAPPAPVSLTPPAPPSAGTLATVSPAARPSSAADGGPVSAVPSGDDTDAPMMLPPP